MKKTITAALLIAGSMNAQAKPLIPANTQFVTMCLQTYTLEDSSISLSECDSSSNNVRDKLIIQKNGCSTGQASIRVLKSQVLKACLPSGLVQL